MNRREFLEVAGLSVASSSISWDAFAQERSSQVLVAAEMNPNSLDCHTVGANRASYGLAMMIYDRLLQFGAKELPGGGKTYDYFKLEPQLAESWQVAPDNSSVTFKLKRDIKFHDDAPMTVKDVKWSFDRFIKVGGFPQRQMEQCSLTDVDQFEAVDDYTFRIKFIRSDKLTLPSLAIVVPSIYNSELCKKNATATDPWALEWTKTNAAGGGAYKVDSFKSGEQVVLSRYEGWKGGAVPAIERAIYRSVAAAGTRRALLERADADVSPDLPPRDVSDIIASKKLTVGSTPMVNTLRYLALSTVIKPFDDVRVRQAVAWAVPYQKVMDSSVFGRGKPMFGASANAPVDASWPTPFPYDLDLDKAKSLLKSAGLETGFATKLYFDSTIATTDEPAALVIQDSLAKVGIRASIEKLPDFAARRGQKNWPMAIDIFGAWFDEPDFFFRWIWHGQNALWNIGSYKNPEMDRLLDAARQERSSAAYGDLVKKFVKIAMTDVPIIPLYQPVLDVVMQKSIDGYIYQFHRQVDARTLVRT